MSEDNKVTGLCLRCASCGIAEIDDVKLKECDGCDLVRYCSDECQHDHNSKHKEACKKRAAELRDELLFKQPEGTHMGRDCPICSLPMPLDIKKSTIYDCCSKLICNGCRHANQIREIELRLQQSCPFCRKPGPKTKSEQDKRRMKRIKANDPVSIRHEGIKWHEKGYHSRAFEYYTKAAELGDADAHYNLSLLYHDGLGVEQDIGKDIYHLEEATIGGHPFARYNLGCEEMDNGNVERAVKHWIIAATQGLDESIKSLMGAFREGFISKEKLAVALRAHHAAVDDMKSPQREAAEESRRFN